MGKAGRRASRLDFRSVGIGRHPIAPALAHIRLHPIKSLDGLSVTESRIGPAGGLELDRVWALFSDDGRQINGKSTPALHRIHAAFAPDVSSVTLSVTGDSLGIAPQELAFPRDVALASRWFSRYLDRSVTVQYAAEGFPDDTIRNGPMIISTASLQAVADWFPEMDLEESRRRFRAPLEIGGVPAFWEDRLYREDESNAVPFTVGDVRAEGTNPCPRCAVPARESRSGLPVSGFQKRFSELRQAHMPSWARASNRITHFYTLGINTRVAATEHGKRLRVGDPVACRDDII